MSSANATGRSTDQRVERLATIAPSVLRISVVVPTLSLIAGLQTQGILDFEAAKGTQLEAVFWTALIAVIEFLPVPAWRSVQMSIGFPLFMAVAFLYSPAPAAGIAFLGASDPRELRREVTVLHALFNRSQIAASVFVGSLIFHALGGTPLVMPTLLLATFLAVVGEYLVNAGLVSLDASLAHHVPFRTVLRKLRIGNPLEFLTSYIGLGFLGVILALLQQVGWWAVGAFLMPLVLVRQMYFRTRALEQATKELKDRELVLHALSNRITEERHEERMQIAGYLHDDLAQTLFRMGVHIEASEKLVILGEDEKAQGELEALKEAKERTVELVRDLIRDLHSSPIGRAGLAEALSQVCAEVENESGVQIHADLPEVEMPAPAQLLCYKLAREAIMNAVKHAGASEIQVGLEETEDGIRVVIRDDGKGFDPDEDAPEGHFGLAMMRERALVAGGTFHVDSAPGRGTTVTAEFPSLWPSEPEEAAGETAE